MSAVNLLGRVLDTPDALSTAPDHISTLYKSVRSILVSWIRGILLGN